MSADYAKGYAAGRRRADREGDPRLADWRREQFRQSVFLAILPELVARPWRTGEEPWTTMDQFVKGAWSFADKAARGTAFSPHFFAAKEEARGDAA